MRMADGGLGPGLLLLTLGAAGLGGCFGEDGSGAASALQLASCTIPGIDRPTECGTVTVPENRERPNRTIALNLVVVRGAAGKAREAVFFMTGGPGTAATASARPLTNEHAALAGSHDFVFLDQRGTGQSAPLACPERTTPILAPMFSAVDAALCRKSLEPAADLLVYTTSDAAADLEGVRRALGYGPIHLHGSSYGTRLAWAYAAQYPAQARTMTLLGPVPPGFLIPLAFPRGLETALNGVIEDCLADEACGQRFPGLRADVDLAFERLSSRPAPVTLEGATESSMTRGELAEGVRYLLYSAMDARRLPLLLTQAAAGDYNPVARALATYRRGLMRSVNTGMYLAVTCAEDIPFLEESAIVETSRNTRLGDYRARQQIEACKAWPRRNPRTMEPRPLRVPTLIQSGAYDPATPLEAARQAAALLPDSRLIVVPHGAHSFAGMSITDCLLRMTTAFVSAGSTAAIDDRCVAEARRPPFVLQ